MKIKYVAPARDYSGYGEASRHDIAALLAARIGVTGKFPHYTLEIADFGTLGEKISDIENADMAYEIIILHTTPNVYPMFMEQGKYHIARVFWETDQLPQDFARCIQLCDEVWTGSQANKDAIIKSGVTKPIYIIPQAIDTSLDASEVEEYKVANQKDFKFYSIFEWTERKNPLLLLHAYWQEFKDDTGVSLTLKTYVDNFTKNKHEEINQNIRIAKKRLGLEKYPPVYIKMALMDRHQMYRFHKTFDCLVSPHRGEGWGIPQMEALYMGKPVISTSYGGVHEYLENGVDAILLPYKMVHLKENSRNMQWYTPDQKWADVDIKDLREAMRQVFENREKADEMGMHGGKTIRELFNPERVGTIMRERLLTIDREILHPLPKEEL